MHLYLSPIFPFQVEDIRDDFLVLMSNGNKKDDVKVPAGDLGRLIRVRFEMKDQFLVRMTIIMTTMDMQMILI